MTPEEKKMLVDTYELSKENNVILKKMRRSALISSSFRVIYILIILGLTYGSYVLIQPYIDQMKGLYGSVQDTVGEVQGVGGSLGNLQNLLNDLKAGQ
jgi:hypothetical protein